ncbi:hypothetical protein [Caulobacter sp. BP25]|uniref:hypothetical protein n=1 Tax=Caulobacter sp. BP25 TaxID=2048900 RepID=UPI000C12BD7A|nr:hypothetical protein [Caulobacter sp. BP25]PHY20808.1 hypothetical protein CSW59_06180 [Caulobacter sp. BP25]
MSSSTEVASPERNPIFRAGRHRAMDGRYYTFSEADVAAIAASYDPAVHQAAYVLGHPKTDAPAWGWVDKLEVQDGQLVAVAGNIDPAFAEGVAAGRYRFRSADFYGPNDPANPKPGQYYLRSVGWLGAEPPAIKGLGAAFSETAEAEPISFAEMDLVSWLASTTGNGFRGIRDWILGKFGQEDADRALGAWTDQAATSIASEARAEAAAEAAPAFSEAAAATPEAAAALKARAAELDAREAVLTERENRIKSDQVAFSEAARTAARDDDRAFVDGLVSAGRLPPAYANQVRTLLGVLDGDQAISFAEGEAAPRDQLRQLLGGLGQAIVFSEVAPAGAAPGELGIAEIAAQTRAIVEEAAARGEQISFAEAGARVRQSLNA